MFFLVCCTTVIYDVGQYRMGRLVRLILESTLNTEISLELVCQQELWMHQQNRVHSAPFAEKAWWLGIEYNAHRINNYCARLRKEVSHVCLDTPSNFPLQSAPLKLWRPMRPVRFSTPICWTYPPPPPEVLMYWHWCHMYIWPIVTYSLTCWIC